MSLPDPSGLSLFRQEPIPVAIVTGFLGSGKTTLIRRLLEARELADTLVIVSEFGEIGLDHLIVQQVSEDVVLLEGGCLCCGSSGDLVRVLGEMLQRRERGELPGFARVIVETSGLADPLPILQTFLVDPLRLSLYRPAAIVAVVDGVLGAETLAGCESARRQLAVADRILVSKLDLPGTAVGPITAAIRTHSAASIHRTDLSPPDDNFLFSEAPAHFGHESGTRQHTHAAHFATRSCRIDHDLDPRRVEAWIAEAGQHADWLLRVKAVLPVTGESQPVVLQMARHLADRHERLPRWPGTERQGFATLIGENVPAAWLDQLLCGLCAARAGADEAPARLTD